MDNFEVNAEKWFWCTGCDSISYMFDCCGNSVCNGGGCANCKELWEEIMKRIREGNHPPIFHQPVI